MYVCSFTLYDDNIGDNLNSIFLTLPFLVEPDTFYEIIMENAIFPYFDKLYVKTKTMYNCE